MPVLWGFYSRMYFVFWFYYFHLNECSSNSNSRSPFLQSLTAFGTPYVSFKIDVYQNKEPIHNFIMLRCFYFSSSSGGVVV